MNRESETFLSPYETNIKVEAWLTNTDHILEPNRYGEFSFEFNPINSTDQFRLEEMIYSAKRRAGLHRNIDIRDLTSSDGRQFECSQVFAPKLNREFEYPGQLARCDDPVSLDLYLRDDKHGNLYLVCSYLDFYEQPEREIVEPPPGYDPDDDF